MFSVVIPLYNKAHTIANTLNTVLLQSFKDFEIIIVDDGSTDNGVEVIKQFSSDPRIQIICQENQGVSAARNKGVDYAKYDYIAFLDGDDEWKPEYLALQCKAIHQFPNAGMFCCGGVVRNSNGIEMLRIAKKYKNQILEVDFFENPHVFLHTSATVVLKSSFLKTGGFPLGMRRNQDFALFFSLALITRVVYSGFSLSVYIGGVSGQATSTPIEQVLQYVVTRYNLTYNFWNKLPVKNDSFIVFMKYELRHLIMVLKIDRKYKAIESLISRLDPEIVKLFTRIERKLYLNVRIRIVAISYIKLTKLRWRMRGYPYVGQSVN